MQNKETRSLVHLITISGDKIISLKVTIAEARVTSIGTIQHLKTAEN